MANASIGGLVSGLDTATIISQLLQLESRPQAMLKTRVSTEQRAVGALQTLNAKIAGIATKANELAKASNWSSIKATSSNAGVAVSADATVTPTSLSISVMSTATVSRAVFSNAMQQSASATSGNSITITDNSTGSSTAVALADTSLTGVAAAINDPANNTGLQATLVRAGGTDALPTYRLVVASAKTGADTGFTIDDGTGSFLGGATLTNGVDAELVVNGASVISSSNTITDVIPGVDVTLSGDATGTATLSIVRDTSGLSDKVKSLVEAANLALGEIDTLTAAGADPKTRGTLAGDATLRTARSQLVEAVSRGIGGESLAPYGVSTDRSGKLVFDEVKFKAAYEADPAKAMSMFTGTAAWTDSSTGTDTGVVTFTSASWRTASGPHTIDTSAGTIDGLAATVTGNRLTGSSGTKADGLSLTFTAGASGTVNYRQGLAAALEAVAQRISNSDNGSVTLAIKGRSTMVDRMQDDIDGWDVRLTQRKSSLERQYGALEVALGKLQSQSTWLAGQISSLPQMGG